MTSTLRLPPLGKPDSSLEKPQGEDTRRRIPIKNKNQALWKACFDIIRDRFNAPNMESCETRIFEKKAAIFFRKINNHIEKHQALSCIIQLKMAEILFSRITLQGMQDVSGEGMAKICESFGKWDYLSFLEDFKKQESCKDLFSFCIQEFDSGLDSRCRIYEEFLLSFKPTALYSIEEHAKKNWTDLTFIEKHSYLSLWNFSLFAKNYGLHITNWTPDQSCLSLIEHINSAGPIIVSGFIGPIYNDTPAKLLVNKFYGHDVYGWTGYANKVTKDKVQHLSIIVGAEKIENIELVYYIVPYDHPDIHAHKIYVMGYQELVDRAKKGICLPEDGYGFQRFDGPIERKEVGIKKARGFLQNHGLEERVLNSCESGFTAQLELSTFVDVENFYVDGIPDLHIRR